jgi:protocatechuate 3,4-dioxygenase beta subunit
LVAADSGKPVRRANITLSGPDSGVRKSASTDANGAFAFTELPPGSFTLAASRPGYLDVTFGQRTPGSGRPGTPIQLSAGQKVDDVTLRMPRTGILTGVVSDEFGDPVMGMQVRAWRFVRRSGERTLALAGNGSTDDRGIYRLAGLLPGDYVVATGARDTSETMMLDVMKMRELAVEKAVAAGGDAGATWSYALPGIQGSAQSGSGYPAIYFPGTMQSSGAVPVTLGISEERSGVDIQLQVAPLATITGSVVGPDGGLPPGGEVRLTESGSTLPAARVFSGPIGRDGTFTISSVPPGQYTLSARTNQRVAMRLSFDSTAAGVETQEVVVRNFELARETVVDAAAGQNAPEPLWGQADVSVDGRPLTNLVLPLRRGYEVSGMFAFDGPPPEPPDLSRIRVRLQPAGAGAETAMPVLNAIYAAGGRFTLRGVTPGRYRLTASGLPSGWTLKSALFGGRDILDTMLEVTGGDELSGGIVTFTRESTGLSGMLQDHSGKPISDFTIVVFPADRRFWLPMARRIQAVRPGTDGRFSFRDLPAGDYRLIAVVDPEPGEWFDPAFLDQLAGAAMPIALNEGERKVQDVRAAR